MLKYDYHYILLFSNPTASETLKKMKDATSNVMTHYHLIIYVHREMSKAVSDFLIELIACNNEGLMPLTSTTYNLSRFYYTVNSGVLKQ